MKKKSSPSVITGTAFRIFGTVHNKDRQPLANVTVQVHSKSIRSMQLLGDTTTDEAGAYSFEYTHQQNAPLSIIVKVYDAKKTLLKESDTQRDIPVEYQMDIEAGNNQYTGVTVFDQVVKTISRVAGDTPLTQLTETETHRDISFITQHTNLAQETIEHAVMAFRFEQLTAIAPAAWYGILCGLQPSAVRGGITRNGRQGDFETKLDAVFDTLMHTNVDVLASSVQKAIEQNIISHSSDTELEKIREQLQAQVLSYAKQHPVTGSPSPLYQKAQMVGLTETGVQSVVEAYNNHAGPEEDFFNHLRSNTGLENGKIDQVQAVFQLSRLTGDDLPLTEKLLKSEKIKSPADIKKLAKYTRSDWESMLSKNGSSLKASDAIGQPEKKQDMAAQLESSFTRAFPTTAFAGRLEKDRKSKLPHREKIKKFLQDNEHFDLLHTRVGQFMKENKSTISEAEAPELEHHLRRTQRIFKLAPTYDAAHALLSKNIHSAQQVCKMGKDNFVAAYSDTLGEQEAEQVFEKASEVHATSLALMTNLQSMSDASTMNAFPDFGLAISQTLSQELPSLETLFGHTDFFDTTESRSVYGAPAYLTDILHFLDNRLSTLDPALINATDTRKPTMKDLLLRRRPDIGDIDLEEKNTTTEIPYIDIACEIMEDFIVVPVVTITDTLVTDPGGLPGQDVEPGPDPTTLLSRFVKGPIDPVLLTAIKNQFDSTGQANISSLLTSAATISDIYTTSRLTTDNTYVTKDHWIIRDNRVTLKATRLGADVEIRVLHQTSLSSDAINAGSEYVNTNVYNNFLKTAKKPFTLPFDLFETEANLYLEKLGTKKADLINIFSRTGPHVLNSAADINMGYASLGINQAEQILIFTPDTANQSLYWGSEATSIAITVNTFEKLTGLNYAQIDNLLKLQFINPTKDSVIEHDDLTADTTKQRITNITPTRLDAIHRFLRLWRKTTLTMDELDAFIVCMSVQNGFTASTLNSTIAPELQQFISLQQTLQQSAFELLGFYADLDIAHNLPDCQYNKVYQNSAIANPVNPDFSIKAIQAQSLALSETHKSEICAILQITKAELNALLSQTSTAAVVTFRTLTIIYRHAQLAHSLGISLADLLTLLRLINTNPFTNPATTSQFVQRYKLLQSSGFSIDDLNYVLRHQNNAQRTLVPTVDQVLGNLSQLQNELLDIKAATTPVVDPNGALLAKWLSDPLLKWDSSIVNKLMDILGTVDDDTYRQKIIDNTNFLLNLRKSYQASVLTVELSALPITIPASMMAQLSFDPDKKQLTLKGVMTVADRDALLALSPDATYQAAINSLFSKILTSNGSGNIFFTSQSDVGAQLNNLLFNNMADRFAFFVSRVSPVYLSFLQRNALMKHISTWFNIDKVLVDRLLLGASEVFADFTANNFINKIADPTPGNPYPVQANRYHFIAKTFFIIRKLGLSVSDADRALNLFLSTGPSFGCLNFRDLPLAPVGGSVSTFPGFEAVMNLLRFHRLYPTRTIPFSTGGAGVYNVFGILLQSPGFPTISTVLAQWKGNLAFAYGWNETDVNTLLTLNITTAADFTAASDILLRLHHSFTTMAQLGVSLADAQRWCLFSLTSTDTAKIKQTLKSKYSNSDWPAVVIPLQNTVREKRRDALIAYLLANPGTQTWKNADDLYSYFLLDVEMCSCQPTSRIVQATNSIQLFVQRCFMGLESSVKVDTKVDADWQQWQWMKNFRIWQANVKVFLYPENWIEPELLAKEVKSSFLQELENDLLQNEVTAESAETAFQNYLEKLAGVARLEIKGMWRDDPSKTLHVIGRTYGGDPKVYYYRKLTEGRRWTPWEKIDLDINSEFIIPVVYNNHVYLFWAIIKQHPNISTSWQIQLAYSEYTNGKWAPRKISENNDSGQIVCGKNLFPDMTRFFFTPLDVPIADYAHLFNSAGDQIDSFFVFNQKLKTAVLQNGTLVISCFYYDPAAPQDLTANKYISSFLLDPAKGYPVKVQFPNQFAPNPLNVATFLSPNRNYINMLDIEPSEPFVEAIPGVNVPVPTQSSGKFRNLHPFQMGIINRVDYIRSTSKKSSPLVQLVLPGFLLPWFHQNKNRTYFVIPSFSDNAFFDNTDFEFRYDDYTNYQFLILDANILAYQPITDRLNAPGVMLRQRHYSFFHQRIGDFMQRLFVNGIDGLMNRETQMAGNGFIDEDVEFSLQSAYGLYNWELFFHAPLMIAERLSQNQQFEEADRWYKYIFNPMDTSTNPSPDKFWNTKPFFINTDNKYITQRIENILNGVNTGNAELIANVSDWRKNPFQPHLIAEYRTVAYQKVAVMKYVGHLIRHADHLFNQHTMESINEATQLYILASEILGPKPEVIPSVAKTATDNYGQLEQKLDAFSDALVDVENLLPQHTVKNYTGVTPNTQGLPSLRTMYFCIPMNEKLMGTTGYWDIVADRLFKIRHCMNIDGTVAPVSIFAPPIDPGLLVRATAAGLDIGNILSDINTSLPSYRFTSMIQKAMELCNEVKSLGALLLSVLEKKDAEAMALLRSGHEIKILNAALSIKQKQVNDAQVMVDSLVAQRELITVRQTYYLGLIKGGLSIGESIALGLNAASATIDVVIALSYLFASGVAPTPTTTVGALTGVSGGAIGLTSEGGLNASEGASSLARNLGAIAAGFDKSAGMINTLSSYDRRKAEWQFQLDSATKELEQIQKQIESAQIRKEIAEQDQINHQLQIDQSKEANDFMRSKFTNEELFNWMITQVSTTYFRSYQLAYEVAKKAERCFRYELGLADSAYINFGYWDSLKKGLLSGEQLAYDLRKMEVAFLDQNKRELELVKHVSLSQLDPVALLKLRTTGECFINLPEEMFDMDYPGHYMRRIKSVSLTIPCITGPYTTVSCTLTMTKNSARISGVAASDAAQYPRKLSNGIPTDDPRFRDSIGSLQSIATSSAQNDSGLFELNFRDERYLPFEGAGAISLWHLQLPAAVRQFDYNTISDVIIHLKYTARDGGAALKANATTSLNTTINNMLVSTRDTGLMRIFSGKHDLATEWYKFLHPANATDDQVLTLVLDASRFPLFAQGKMIKIKSVELAADSANAINNIQIIAPASAATAVNLAAGAYGSWKSGTADYSQAKKDTGTWVIKNPVANARLTESMVNNLAIIVHYEVS